LLTQEWVLLEDAQHSIFKAPGATAVTLPGIHRGVLEPGMGPCTRCLHYCLWAAGVCTVDAIPPGLALAEPPLVTHPTPAALVKAHALCAYAAARPIPTIHLAAALVAVDHICHTPPLGSIQLVPGEPWGAPGYGAAISSDTGCLAGVSQRPTLLYGWCARGCPRGWVDAAILANRRAVAVAVLKVTYAGAPVVNAEE
jgi:hypothetical protein